LFALAAVLVLALRDELTGRLAQGLRTVGYYWHFVDAVWVVVFAVVYGRGAL
jgi:heme/copper-type cytochrome/quinol oxidase subunit 3